MIRRKRIAAIIAAVLLVAMSVGGGLAATDNVRTVDKGTTLATEDGVESFQQSGQATGNVSDIQLSVTVAQTPEAVNASGFQVAQVTKYVRVDYDEEIQRDIRLHIDGDIIIPRLRQGVTPIDPENNVTADFEVADGGEMQSMTLHLEGETHAVFAVSTITGQIQKIRRTVGQMASNGIENATGIDVPRFGGGEWQRVSQDALSGTNVSTALPGESLTVQYRTGNESWMPVPECSAEDPVCTVQRGNETLLVSTTDDAPDVRYKQGNDVVAGVKSGIDDVTSVPSDIEDKLDDLLGGDD